METLTDLLKQRKWYNAYLYLQAMDRECLTTELIEQFLKTVLPIASQMHPFSLTTTTINITENYPSRFEVLSQLREKINESVLKTDEHAESLTLIDIVLAEIKLERGLNIEESVYGFRNMKLTREQQKHFNRLALKYYEKMRNYNEAYYYAKKQKNIDKMMEYSVFAPNIFNLPVFDDEPEYFRAVREGNYRYIKDCKIDNHEFVLQKTYIIKMLDLCYNKHTVSISELCSNLELERVVVLRLIIKALGLKLIRGAIDGANDSLAVSHIYLQTVTKKELLHMKEQFVKWKARVDKVIATME
ncbi:26S proteasome regulatory complex, subunit RPN9/PSMD13 [Trachipleistophora hominis]|uniref:26S proteasome regulatory complex, subunit RPN9/PSMD13 n=1 Tax=Trachipleistophora hominis TaxID=72359 RepID=L7JVE0_TRAHO|nr:26S proteasome regulatory complex, subunit RPN9/PSMD13 [Trachipleistophora hominis]